VTYSRYEPPAHADDVARAIIGAAIEVHRHLGPGFLESAYQRAMEVEMAERCMPFERQKTYVIQYKGADVGDLRIDLVVGGCVVVELKSVDGLASIHYSQLASYLRGSNLPLGLLINFNSVALKHGIRRVIPPQTKQKQDGSLVPPWILGAGKASKRPGEPER